MRFVFAMIAVLMFSTSFAAASEKVDTMLKTFVSVAHSSGSIVKCWEAENGDFWAYVLTAAHVVKDAKKDGQPLKVIPATFYIFDDNGRVQASHNVNGIVEEKNDEIDYAICSFQIGELLPVAKLRTVRDYELFQDVFAVGRPNGEFPFISRGILSSFNMSNSLKHAGFQLGHDAKIYYGSSGGPLFNESGEQIAVNLGMGVDKRFGPIPTLCYSLPIASIVEDLGEEKSLKYLAVEPQKDEEVSEHRLFKDSVGDFGLSLEVQHHAPACD